MTGTRRVRCALAAAALVVGACSDDDRPPGATASTGATAPVPSGPARSSSTTPTPTPTPTSAPAPTAGEVPGAETTSTAAAPVTPTSGGGTAIAEAQGWRLAVGAPAPGATVGSTATLCYEVSGPTREPDVALEVRVFPDGAATGTTTLRVGGSVGRGSADVDLGRLTAGRYDLEVQLIADGAPVDGVVVSIPDVTRTHDSPTIACSSIFGNY